MALKRISKNTFKNTSGGQFRKTGIDGHYLESIVKDVARQLITITDNYGVETTFPFGTGGGYEPDGITIQLTKDNKLRVVDYEYITKYNADGDFIGHQKFRGNIEVIYNNVNAHYGANTVIRELPGEQEEEGPTYTLYWPNKNGTIAVIEDIPTNISQFNNDSGYTTKSYVDSKVAATTKYIHKVNITGMTEKSPFTSSAEMTLIFINKAANEINSFQAIAANYKNIVGGQIYDGSNNKIAQINLLTITQLGVEFIVDNQILGYSAEDFEGATFEDTTKDF